MTDKERVAEQEDLVGGAQSSGGRQLKSSEMVKDTLMG